MSAAAAGTLKRLAGEKAASLVKSGMRVGLGTGSTVRFSIEKIGELLQRGELSDVVGVPTSEATAELARTVNIPLSTLEETPDLDVAIDGADEVDPSFQLVKGWGAALLREKMVELCAKRLVIVVDGSKLVPRLGKRGVPVEVVRFGCDHVRRQLASLGCIATLRRAADGQLLVTDNGNHIVDCVFEDGLADAAAIAARISAICGVVEHGLFLSMATDVVCASETGVDFLEKGFAV